MRADSMRCVELETLQSLPIRVRLASVIENPPIARAQNLARQKKKKRTIIVTIEVLLQTTRTLASRRLLVLSVAQCARG